MHTFLSPTVINRPGNAKLPTQLPAQRGILAAYIEVLHGKYLLCNQGVREEALLHAQEVTGSSPVAPSIQSTTYRSTTGKTEYHESENGCLFLGPQPEALNSPRVRVINNLILRDGVRESCRAEVGGRLRGLISCSQRRRQPFIPLVKRANLLARRGPLSNADASDTSEHFHRRLGLHP